MTFFALCHCNWVVSPMGILCLLTTQTPRLLTVTKHTYVSLLVIALPHVVAYGCLLLPISGCHISHLFSGSPLPSLMLVGNHPVLLSHVLNCCPVATNMGSFKGERVQKWETVVWQCNYRTWLLFVLSALHEIRLVNSILWGNPFMFLLSTQLQISHTAVQKSWATPWFFIFFLFKGSDFPVVFELNVIEQ